MAKVRERLAFTGTKAEFHAFLRTDPRFFPKTPDEIGDKLMAAMREMEPKLDGLFLRRPKAPYGVKRLDPRLEGSMTYGYYQVPTPRDPKGYYNYNGSKLESRSLLNVRALAFHELAPGHHFQINLQTENGSLPPIRRETRHTAYTEGWGEYASSLGDEAGLFADPYDQYGRLMMDMFLSVRLVVDTGMNALGWSRERAMDVHARAHARIRGADPHRVAPLRRRHAGAGARVQDGQPRVQRAAREGGESPRVEVRRAPVP